MAEKENKFEKAENAELREAYDTPSVKIESNADGDVFDTIIIKKNNDTASVESVTEDESDADDSDEDGDGAIDTLNALLYDDDDDTEFKPNDNVDAKLPDIFAIGDMIPKISQKAEEIETGEGGTDEAIPEEETVAETVEDGEPESEGDETVTESEETVFEPCDGEKEDAETAPEQIEFDLGESEESKDESKNESEGRGGDDVAEEEAPEKYDPEKPRFIDTVFDYFELLIFTLTAVMVLTSFVFKHSVVEGSSMDQTLSDGEHLIIYGLFYQPERGDIIVCEDYSTRLKKPIVKRVIALPGEHIVISADGTVTIDGEVLDESGYVYINNLDYEYAPLDLVVPEGEVFVMGDHRNVSDDSRSEGVGTIDIDSILGKVVLRIYPFGEKFGPVE